MAVETRMLRSLLAVEAATSPTSTAVMLPDGTSWTFAELDDAVERVRAKLPENARIGVRLANDAAAIVAIHAVMCSGGTVVSIGHATPAVETERRLAVTGARAFLEPAEDGLEVDVTALAPDSPGVRGDGEVLVMFTSGTTGVPKAAAITDRALEASVKGIAVGSGLPPYGREAREPARSPQPVFVPLAHMGGTLGTITSWWLGKPVMLCPKFSVALVAEITRKVRIGVLRLTPAMMYELAHAPAGVELPGVTSATVGTAALPEQTQQDFEERYGVPVLRNYGQTEFAGAIAFERPEDVIAGHRPPGSVGRAAPGVEIRIVGAGGTDVAVGEVGEIHARSASAMSGYLGASPTSDDGWLATGDLGRLDEHGYLTIAGRVRDMIVCGGFNIYPAQLEAALNRLPGVADSAVAAMPDERLGEIPVAVVVLRAGASLDGESIRSELREQLAAYELPRRVMVVDAIPRFESGKVDRDGIVSRFSEPAV